ncbi:MAG TPA: cupin domain-containing protein [Streptosporangiaceae bacterium]|jgi:quercetin dioxygenase-like cupin family protein
MSVIRTDETRRTETPAGVMTTLASPAQGGAAQVMWRVEMPPGASGPLHAFDAEQVWTVLDGGATVERAGEPLALAAGDTIVLPADAARQVFADPVRGFTAIAAAPAGALAYSPGAALDVKPDCAMPAGDGRLAPAWLV